MRLKDVTDKAKASNYAELLLLPPPPADFGARAGVGPLYDSAQALYECFKTLISPEPDGAPKRQPSNAEQWSRLALVVGAYYSHVLELQVAKGLPDGRVLRPGVTIPSLKALLGAAEPSALFRERLSAATLMASYLAASITLDVRGIAAGTSRPASAMQPLVQMEGLGHAELLLLHRREMTDPQEPLRRLARETLARAARAI